jgi:Ca2+-binding EF-hand superfamily protein
MTSDIHMILQEIHNMAMLDHPNVVKVFEYFDDDCYLSQIIEPCNGGELKARVEAMHKRGDSPYTEAFVRDVMKQTMRALAFMHTNRFAHKDLKPENIMMVDKGSSSIKIIDFGLAELFNPQSDHSMMIGGTLLFMPPEVFLTSQMTFKCDIWSAGVVLYNLITGTYPYMGEWPPPKGKDTAFWEEETAERIISHPMAKHEKLAQASRECQNLLLHILEKDPSCRPDATQCLECTWFQRHDTMPTLSVGVVQCIEAYARMSELKKAIFLLMAHQSAVPALNELREIFTHFDVGNRGVLTAQDLRLVLATVGMPSLTSERVVHALDRDASGVIGWTEFLSAALCVSICRNEKLVESAFMTFDTDRDGKITVGDLQQVLGGTGGYPGWRDRLPDLFVEMIPEKFRPAEGQGGRHRKLWVSKEQFKDYVGQHIELRMPGHKLFAVS